MTGQADAGGAQSRSYGGAAQAGHATQVPADGAVARQLGEHVYSAESLEPSVAHDISVKAARDLGPERCKGGNAKIGETDPASCRKASEIRSRF